MTNDEALKILPDMKGAGEDWDKAIDLAVEALKRETSGDAIDRQEAIRIASGYCHFTNVAKELEKLPSVQPVDKDINVSCKDAISRQAVIDALGDEPEVWSGDDEYAQGLNNQWHYDVNSIKAVPSVQPEIMPDGTLRITVNADVANIDRILLTQAGTHTGDLYYKDDEKPEPQWIPCRETVDIPDHEILACDKYGEEMFGYLSYEDDQWLCVSDDCMMYDPIAWREKPEPYQEGE